MSKVTAIEVDTSESSKLTNSYSNTTQNASTETPTSGPAGSDVIDSSGFMDVSQTYQGNDHQDPTGHRGGSTAISQTFGSSSQIQTIDSGSSSSSTSSNGYQALSYTATGKYTPSSGQLLAVTITESGGTDTSATSSSVTALSFLYGGGAQMINFTVPTPVISPRSTLFSQLPDVSNGMPQQGTSVDADVAAPAAGAPAGTAATGWQYTALNVGVGAVTGAITGAVTAIPGAFSTGSASIWVGAVGGGLAGGVAGFNSADASAAFYSAPRGRCRGNWRLIGLIGTRRTHPHWRAVRQRVGFRRRGTCCPER